MAEKGRRRMGWLGWAGVVLLVFAGCLYGVYRIALFRNPVALLDLADRTLRMDGDPRLAAAARYGSDPAQKIRFYVPDSAKGPLPVVVFVHGGGWDSGDPDDYTFIARAIAPKGYAVALAGYRLYPRSVYPGMLEDTAGAVRWVREHAAALGGDPQRIVLAGHSAGAYNAVMVALDREWLDRAGVQDGSLRGVIGLAGPYDFLPLDSPMTVASFGHAPDLPATQPVRYARSDAPPLLLLTGDRDTTVRPRNSIAMARAMTAAGAPTKAEIFTGIDHQTVLTTLARPFSRDPRVLDSVLRFLARVTAPAPSAQVQRPAGMPAG